MNRFFIDPERLSGGCVDIPDDIAGQIRKVLRLKEGEAVQFLDNQGWMYDAEISYPDPKHVTAVITGKQPAEGEPSCFVTLYLALTQREKFEWILQKCTEAGVSRVVPMITERTIVRKSADASGKQERWEKILKEAAEQCERARIPELLPAVPLKQAVSMGAEADLPIFCYEDEHHTTLKDLIDPKRGNIRTASLMVGPEGGFAPAEAEYIQQHGWNSCTLGDRIYRVETAAMAGVILTLYEVGR